jgi:hypothetical protein
MNIKTKFLSKSLISSLILLTLSFSVGAESLKSRASLSDSYTDYLLFLKRQENLKIISRTQDTFGNGIPSSSYNLKWNNDFFPTNMTALHAWVQNPANNSYGEWRETDFEKNEDCPGFVAANTNSEKYVVSTSGKRENPTMVMLATGNYVMATTECLNYSSGHYKYDAQNQKCSVRQATLQNCWVW